ncbi:MAG: aquaporin [Chloroflexota bacterium]
MASDTVRPLTAVPGAEPAQMRATEPPNDSIFHYVVEAIGTFALIFMGVATIAHNGGVGQVGKGANDFFGGNLVAIALAHGLAIGLAVAATGHISGGAFNPAIVLALLIARKITPIKGALYVAAQLVGAVLGAAAVTLVFPNEPLKETGFGVPSVGAGFSVTNALVAEIITTFFLAYVIFGVAIDKRGPSTIAALCIGLTITMDILATGSVSGAAMNPARWFGPAVVAGNFANAWIWWVGPGIGASLAAGLYYYGYLRGRHVA